MLAHISTIIDQSKHSLAAALAIDAVSALCQTNVRPTNNTRDYDESIDMSH